MVKSDYSRSSKLAVLLHADIAGSTMMVQRDAVIAHDRIMNYRMISNFFIIGFLSFTISACDGIPAGKDPNPFHLPPDGFVGDSTKGKVLFTQNCSNCHGVRSQGTNQGPPLVHNTYNPRHHADMAFNLAVKNGVRSHHWQFGDMKPLPDVSPQDVGNITSYVREMQRSAGIK